MMSQKKLIGMIIGVVIVAAVALVVIPRLLGPGLPKEAPQFPVASLVIRRADGQTFPFKVEVATTPEQEMYGLMFRRFLPRDSGMLFIYDPDQPVSMWMKNTSIPLDMLFIRHDGTIVKIAAYTISFDLTPISSGQDVHGVLEINAGEAERRGLKTGDQVLFPAFSAPAVK